MVLQKPLQINRSGGGTKHISPALTSKKTKGDKKVDSSSDAKPTPQIRVLECFEDDGVTPQPITGYEPFPPSTTFGDKDCCLPLRDGRAIVWELHRPSIFARANEHKASIPATIHDFQDLWRENANGTIVSYTPALTTALACNTAIYFLGTEEQAKNSGMYMFKYFIKDSTDISVSLATAIASINHCNTFKSTAADEGTDFRNAVYFWQNLTNKFRQSDEFSATQVAACVAGQKSSYCSDRFSMCFLKAAIRHAKLCQLKQDNKSSDELTLSPGLLDYPSDFDPSSTDSTRLKIKLPLLHRPFTYTNVFAHFYII